MSRLEKPRQLPFDLGHVAGYSRDDLIVSPANRQALDFMDQWPEWPSPLALLAGPSGAGKSHIAAIWQEVSGAQSVPANRIAQAVAKFDDVPPVLIDDADAADLDEAGLFHLINTARATGSTILLTARRFPAAWGVKLPDLASRLKTAAIIEIQEPDDLLLAGVMTKLFADRQVEVDQQVIQFIVRRIERSLSTAIRIVERLDMVALEQKTRITRVMAAETISALDEGQAEFGI